MTTVTEGNYLRDSQGYLDPAGGYRRGIYLEDAHFVADRLQRGTSVHALRRFFNRVKAIERSMEGGRRFDAHKNDLYSLIPHAAYAVKRGLASAFFPIFIERNVMQAVTGWDQLEGFVKHFESVVAYFPTDTSRGGGNTYGRR